MAHRSARAAASTEARARKTINIRRYRIIVERWALLRSVSA
jgi:hypothetical protein